VDAAADGRAGGAGNGGANAASGARGDALMMLPDGLVVGDVSVIHPAAQSYVREACKATGAAAAARDAFKVAKYRASPMGGACEFVPLSVESYGRMGAPAMALLRKVAGLAAESRRVNKQRWLTGALRKLSVALMRGNSWAFKAGLSVGVRRSPGRAFQAGLVMAAEDES